MTLVVSIEIKGNAGGLTADEVDTVACAGQLEIERTPISGIIGAPGFPIGNGVPKGMILYVCARAAAGSKPPPRISNTAKTITQAALVRKLWSCFIVPLPRETLNSAYAQQLIP